MVIFASFLTLEYPDHHHNLFISSLYYPEPLHQISSQSVHNFLSNVVHKQTNRRTNQCYQIHILLCQGENYRHPLELDVFYTECISNRSALNFNSKFVLSMFDLFAVSTMSKHFNSICLQYRLLVAYFGLQDDHSASDFHSRPTVQLYDYNYI